MSELTMLCPVCRCQIEHGQTISCDECGTPHHKDCWGYCGGCAVFGCQKALKVARSRPLALEDEKLLPPERPFWLMIFAGTVSHCSYFLAASFAMILLPLFVHGFMAFQSATVQPPWLEAFLLSLFLVPAGIASGVGCDVLRSYLRTTIGPVKDWRPLDAIEEGVALDPRSRAQDFQLKVVQGVIGAVATGLLVLDIGFGPLFTTWQQHKYFFVLLGVLWWLTALVSVVRYWRGFRWSRQRLKEWRDIRRSLRLPPELKP